eukprot:scaffold3303_cov37-Cyclotella_meneghiniana.AAC.1
MLLWMRHNKSGDGHSTTILPGFLTLRVPNIIGPLARAWPQLSVELWCAFGDSVSVCKIAMTEPRFCEVLLPHRGCLQGIG